VTKESSLSGIRAKRVVNVRSVEQRFVLAILYAGFRIISSLAPSPWRSDFLSLAESDCEWNNRAYSE